MTTLVNLTPHSISIVLAHDTFVLAPSNPDLLARAIETSEPADVIVTMSDERDGHVALPTSRVRYTGISGLPDPSSTGAVMYVVSLPVVLAARELGRPTHDLLVPAGQVRDAQGRITGCTSLQRF